MEKAKKKVATLELKLERAKKLELDALVSVALKRLGVCSLDPINSIRGDEEEIDPTADDDDEVGDKQPAVKQNSQENDPFYTTLIEQMLRHKRLSTAMDQINDKVSEYQSWANHREQVILGGDNSEPKRGKKKKQQSSSKEQNETLIVAGGTKRRKIDLGGHEGASGLFIGSLSGQKVDGYSDDDDDVEGYDDDHDFYKETKKKNRPGQRARKAKAMAIEAKKAGKTWDSSINWREKKEDQNQDHDRGSRRHQVKNDKRGGGKHSNDGSQAAREGSTKPTKAKSQDIATMGKFWKEDGKAHPSWAAAGAQKSQGIVEFKGTKITF